MRTHSEIVRDTGAAKIAELTDVPASTVYSWARRNSIPADHWLVLVAEGHCTAAELMAGAAKERAA